jgi:adenylate/nucleoside-diphosphate kinase
LPQAKKLEGNEKELLTVGLEEKKLVRKWSKWGIVDPVELFRSRLVNGKSEFAAEYAGRVFLFENEKNQADFIL